MKGNQLVIERQSELQGHLSREADIKIRLKLAFLQCFAQITMDLDKLCEAFGIATSTGYWWIRIWNKQGYEGLLEGGGRAGRPPRLDDLDLSYLALLLKEKSIWTTQEVRALIKHTFDLDYSSAQVVRILRKRLKMYFSKPFPHDYRRPAEAEDILKERLNDVFNSLKEKGLKKKDIAIGFVDETSPQNRANTVRVWSFDSHPVITKNTDHFKSNTIGFYAIQGHSIQAFLANSKEGPIQAFLEQIKAANPDYSAIVIILDNYASHKSAKVKATAERLGIYLVYLPAYSPDLSPEEYLWKSLRRRLSAVFINNLDEMKSLIKKAWDELSNNLGFAEHWIAEFLTMESAYSELCN